MFVMLTVTPIIILNAVMKEAERSICCVNCYSCTCGQYVIIVFTCQSSIRCACHTHHHDFRSQ